MIRIVFRSWKNAERNGLGRPYAARLIPGPRGALNRRFLPETRRGSSKQVKVYDFLAEPGDIYEVRRWFWNHDRERYEGGTAWLGVQADGELFPLTREEAMVAVLSDRVPGAGGEAPNPRRLAPPDIEAWPAEGCAPEPPQLVHERA